MDTGRGMRALVERFGDGWFTIKEIPNENIREIAALFGVRTSLLSGTRSRLGTHKVVWPRA